MLDAGQSQILDQLAKVAYSDVPARITNSNRRTLLHSIVEYYQIHLEGMGEIKSLSVLSELFSEG